MSNSLKGGGYGQGGRKEPAEGLMEGEVGVGELDRIARRGEEGGGGEGLEEVGEFMFSLLELLFCRGDGAAAVLVDVVMLSGKKREEKEALVGP